MANERYSFTYQGATHELDMSSFSSKFAGSKTGQHYKATLTNTGIPTQYYSNGSMLYAQNMYSDKLKGIRIASADEPSRACYLRRVDFSSTFTGSIKVEIETCSNGAGADGSWATYDDGSTAVSSVRVAAVTSATYVYLEPNGVGIRMQGEGSMSGTRYRIRVMAYSSSDASGAPIDELFMTYVYFRYFSASNVVEINQGPVTGRLVNAAQTVSNMLAWSSSSSVDYAYSSNAWSAI